ncbi:helix-turn-helix domain-containing protein [Streptomyces sp. NPDC007346]|uniref:helix-turn-helix domain-containing protein n=1 Tax=Streptomyces sp. NPDC007346 TaxID=3154682 RepID=UPI00345639A4
MGSAEWSDIGEMIGILELLAAEAPPAEVADLLQRVRSHGADPTTLAQWERAERLAQRVHALFSHRQQREAELASLLDTARELSASHGLDALLKTITRRARTLLGLDMACVSLGEPEAGGCLVRAADGHASAMTVGLLVPGSHGLGDEAMARSVPLWTPDYLSDDRLRRTGALDEAVRAEGLRAMIAAPLRFGDETYGVLYAGDRGIRHFTIGEVSLMSLLGDIAAVAIEKACLLERGRAEAAALRSGISRAKSQLVRARELVRLHHGLVDHALAGRSLKGLVAELADALCGAVQVKDPEQRTLGAAGDVPDIDAEEALEASRAALARRLPVVLSTGTWMMPVTAGDEQLGALLLHPHAPDYEADEQLLLLAAQSVSVLLRLQSGEAAVASTFRDELFDDLLASPRPSRQVLQRATRLNVDLERPHAVVVIAPEAGELARAAGWAASYARRMDGLRSVQQGRVALLLPAVDSSASAAKVFAELSPLLTHPVTVGAAGPVSGPDLVRQTHQEARHCLDALISLGSAGAHASPGDLGFLGMLLSDNRNAAHFIAATIGPVLDYDAQRTTELTRTLHAYFTAGGSPTHAAGALHVHPNTVSRRLERITELLGSDWLKPERALEVQVALRLHLTHRLLRQKRHHGPDQGDRPELLAWSDEEEIADMT